MLQGGKPGAGEVLVLHRALRQVVALGQVKFSVNIHPAASSIIKLNLAWCLVGIELRYITKRGRLSSDPFELSPGLLQRLDLLPGPLSAVLGPAIAGIGQQHLLPLGQRFFIIPLGIKFHRAPVQFFDLGRG